MRGSEPVTLNRTKAVIVLLFILTLPTQQCFVFEIGAKRRSNSFLLVARKESVKGDDAKRQTRIRGWSRPVWSQLACSGMTAQNDGILPLDQSDGTSFATSAGGRIHDDPTKNPGREFWLDLRGTAILPYEALNILEQMICEQSFCSNGDYTDTKSDNTIHRVCSKIILSEDMFYKALSSIDTEKLQSDIFCATNQGNDLIRSLQRGMKSHLTGKIFSCRKAETFDPMGCLETISSNGMWVLIDTDPLESWDFVAEQVSTLLEFVSHASILPYESSDGSELLLQSPSNPSSVASERGGLAMVCPSKSSLMQMHMLLEKSRGSNMMTTATESGILVPTGMTDPRGFSPLPTALVLPFDSMMWMTALEL